MSDPPPRFVPFRRGAFRALPEVPRRPHIYFQTRILEVPVSTPALGPARAHVRVHGAGPPLLLVHGLMTSSYSWRYALEPLGREFTLYVPDLPGAGRSVGPLAPSYEPRSIAAWLAALQRELGIRGSSVIGNSMGGYLCMWLALEDPGAVGRLLNVHSPGVPEARLYALGAALSLPGVKPLLSAWIRRDPLRWAHANVHYWDESLKSLEEAREYGKPLAVEGGAAAFIKYLGETMAVGPMRSFQRTLRERRSRGEPFPVPLLHLYARRDPMVPPRFGGVLAGWTGAPIVWLDGASHFAHVDATDRFADAALAFLVPAAGRTGAAAQ